MSDTLLAAIVGAAGLVIAAIATPVTREIVRRAMKGEKPEKPEPRPARQRERRLLWLETIAQGAGAGSFLLLAGLWDFRAEEAGDDAQIYRVGSLVAILIGYSLTARWVLQTAEQVRRTRKRLRAKDAKEALAQEEHAGRQNESGPEILRLRAGDDTKAQVNAGADEADGGRAHAVESGKSGR